MCLMGLGQLFYGQIGKGLLYIAVLALGIIGEYIGKIYSEVKRRPRYIVESFTGDME